MVTVKKHLIEQRLKG